MFDFKKEKQSKSIDVTQEKTEAEQLEAKQEIEQEMQASEETKDDTLKSVEKIDLSGVRIHSMPDKFFGSGKKVSRADGVTHPNKLGSSNLKKNILIGVIIGVLVLGLLSLAGWFLIKSIEKPGPTGVVINQPEPVEQPQPEPIPEPVEQPQPQVLCSAENCEVCSNLKCEQMNEWCHLEDECDEIDYYENPGSCPKYECAIGPELIDDPEPNQPIELKMARDSDNDLLTDIEEGVWGTNPNAVDTDGDTYSDGSEIQNLYDPVAGASKSLDESSLIKNYSNSKYGYTLYYPAAWQVNKLNDDLQEIVFNSNTGEFIEVIVQYNSAGFYSAREWYLSQFPNMNLNNLTEVLIGNWSGVRSPDGLNVYLVNNNYIYTITYNVGLKKELNYQTTFKMMQNSFRLFENPL